VYRLIFCSLLLSQALPLSISYLHRSLIVSRSLAFSLSRCLALSCCLVLSLFRSRVLSDTSLSRCLAVSLSHSLSLTLAISGSLFLSLALFRPLLPSRARASFFNLSLSRALSLARALSLSFSLSLSLSLSPPLSPSLSLLPSLSFSLAPLQTWSQQKCEIIGYRMLFLMRTESEMLEKTSYLLARLSVDERRDPDISFAMNVCTGIYINAYKVHTSLHDCR